MQKTTEKENKTSCGIHWTRAGGRSVCVPHLYILWGIKEEWLLVEAKGCSTFQQQIVSSWMQVKTAHYSFESCRLAQSVLVKQEDSWISVCFSHLVGLLVVYSLTKRCAPRMWEEIRQQTALAHERKSSGSFQGVAELQNLLAEHIVVDDCCSTLL